MGGDGKPYLPEGYSQAQPTEVKASDGTPMAWDRATNTARPIGGMTPGRPKFEDIASLRKDISALPETKRYGEAAPIFRSMVKSAPNPSAAADLDFVYGVAKIFDPDSVVREGEMKLVGQAQSLPEDIKGFIQRVTSGQGRLTQEARYRILEVAQTRMNELRGAYDTRLTHFTASRSVTASTLTTSCRSLCRFRVGNRQRQHPAAANSGRVEYSRSQLQFQDWKDAMITITTPEAVLQFPDDAPQKDIRSAIEQYAKTPEARQSALTEWANQFVKLERSQGGMGQAVGDVVRNLARGTPVGSWLDEANARTADLTGQASYDEAVAYQRATDRALDADSGWTGTGTKVVGGIGGALAAPVVHVARGAAMLPQVANMAATGGLYGALFGAGEGENLKDRVSNTGIGAGLGAGLGAASVPVARGFSNAVAHIADKIKGIPGPLAGFERGAIDRVSRAAADDIPNPAGLPAMARQYGQEGMIADLGPNLQGQVGAIARTPGEGKAIAIDALLDRADSAVTRIRASLDQNLGPEINLPQAAEAIERTAANQARPLYEQFRRTPVTHSHELETIVSTLRNEPSVLRDARRMANLDPNSGSGNSSRASLMTERFISSAYRTQRNGIM